MNFFNQFGDLGLKNADLFSGSLVKCKKAVQFRVKDGIVNPNSIGSKGLKRKELLRRKLPTGKRTKFLVRGGIHAGYLLSGAIVFQQVQGSLAETFVEKGLKLRESVVQNVSDLHEIERTLPDKLIT
jgi:hypothetical protein